MGGIIYTFIIMDLATHICCELQLLQITSHDPRSYNKICRNPNKFKTYSKVRLKKLRIKVSET